MSNTSDTDAVGTGAAPMSRASEAAREVRARILDGQLKPGQHVPEAQLAESLGISRNTLRETFKTLAQEGLVTQTQHRGTWVAVPSMSTIIDVYRVRRMIEVQAMANALPRHPAITHIRDAVEAAVDARARNDWPGVGTANIRFHRAIVELADSPRLSQFYERVATELRLAFGLIDDPAYLHAPFLDWNGEIVEVLENGEPARAAERLEEYLLIAERVLLAGYERAVQSAR
ncbi:GntR family transcriptional regulator [Microbacterium sp.]|uniref:GntR family transcriptional regulator n=1 Tax=Microbacterium sp. TaxID=51671 RepID=UPI003C74BD58